MGVRLYPVTKDPRVLEKLAGVPAGTMAKLNGKRAIKVCTRKGVDYYHVPGQRQLVPVREYREMSLVWDQEFDLIYADEDTARLSGFLNSGWGKLSSWADGYLVGLGHCDERGVSDCVGHIDDPGQVATLLNFMALDDISIGVSEDRLHYRLPVSEQTFYGSYGTMPIAELGGVYWC